MHNITRYYLYYRQLDPTKNKIAKESSQPELNMKKLEVNSQVTAMIAIMEFFGSLTFRIIQLLELELFKVSTIFSLSYSLTVYFIILPYIFVMNTSNNKNRVVEIGWMNVLRNIVGKTNVSLENVECNSDPVSVEHKIVSKKKIGRRSKKNTDDGELFITMKYRGKQSSKNINNNNT